MGKRPLLVLFTLLPLVAIGFGVQYWIHTHRTQGGSGTSNDSAWSRKAGGTVGAGSGTTDNHSSAGTLEHGEAKPSTRVHAVAKESNKESNHGGEVVREIRDETTEDIQREEREARAKAVGDYGDGLLTPKESASDGVCHSIEYRGEGSVGSRYTDAEWAKVQSQFTAGREALLAWLQKRKKEIPDKAVLVMENQLKSVHLEKPPIKEEPDLVWRGIGVFTYNSKGAPLVRLGGGFVKLVSKHPRRAQFEMTRLLAQAWAPCEIQRLEPSEVWSPLLDCMKVSRETSCSPGTSAEEGWAVSSALASLLHSPGCSVPGLTTPEVASCLQKLPLPLTLETIQRSAQNVRKPKVVAYVSR